MLEDARTGKIDVVVCWKLDRLFRSLKDLIITLNRAGWYRGRQWLLGGDLWRSASHIAMN